MTDTAVPQCTFYGAAGTVTGSMTLVKYGRTRFLVDCGLYQGLPTVEAQNWEPFLFPVAQIDFVLLTHAHLDHCGRLPLLYKNGFQGRVYCTSATADLAEIIMKDSAKIQEEDAKYAHKRWEREQERGSNGPPREIPLDGDVVRKEPRLEPLYTMHDAESVLKRFDNVRYGREVKVSDGVRVLYRDAGHILGSATIQIRFPEVGGGRDDSRAGGAGDEDGYTIVFSGDLGRSDQPIIRDPTPVPGCDLLVLESTYGGRVHKDPEEHRHRLARLIRYAYRRGGRVLIPAFAVGRTQTLMYVLKEMLGEGRIPHLTAYFDSPMALRATDTYIKHTECYDEETVTMLKSGDDPFWFSEMQLARTQKESIAINTHEGPCIVISSAGMCTGGRVRHHLKRVIEDRSSAIIFVGYQAEGTLGRQIVDREPVVDIFGRRYHVHAKIASIQTFSAHADQNDLVAFVGAMDAPRPRRVILNHGEPRSSKMLKKWLEAELNGALEVDIATQGMTVRPDTV